jgi:CRP-like cAMP-binding protein
VLERRGRPIKAVYFLESGFASVVADGGKRPIEVGLIGREGMTGLPVILGNDRNSHEVYMQAAGQGRCVRAGDLRKAIEKSPSLHLSLLRFAHMFLEQTMRTVVANGRSIIEERLARWS